MLHVSLRWLGPLDTRVGLPFREPYPEYALNTTFPHLLLRFEALILKIISIG